MAKILLVSVAMLLRDSVAQSHTGHDSITLPSNDDNAVDSAADHQGHVLGQPDHGGGHVPFFHLDTSNVQVLFEKVQTATEGEYWCLWSILSSIAVTDVYMKSVLANLEISWPDESHVICHSNSNVFVRIFLPVFGRSFPLRNNMIRCVFKFVITTVDFMLMLVTMTFNVGLFFAIMSGFSVGYLFFGHTFKKAVLPTDEEIVHSPVSQAVVVGKVAPASFEGERAPSVLEGERAPSILQRDCGSILQRHCCGFMLV